MSKSKKRSVEDKYTKLDPHEHVLTRPNTYIGSIKKTTKKMWIYNDEAKDESDPKIILKEISYVPGYYKICDEILVNVIDRTVEKLKIPCTRININIDKKTGQIVVWNNGDGVPVVEHKKEKMLIPSMIFGSLMSGSNLKDEDDVERITGGVNGLGAKLTNIFSTEFEVETLDQKRGKLFYQKFTNNMYDKTNPKVTDTKETDPYTQISFIADFGKFGLKGITKDMFNLLKKRAYDVAMCSGVKVYFNNKLIKENTLQKYTELYFPATAVEDDDQCPKVFDIKSNSRWKVAVVFDKTNKFDHENISFVNGICTSNGGTHVDHVTNQIVNKLKDLASKKLKGITIKPSMIKENLIFFVNSQINKPDFNSQSKEKLESPAKDFGSEYKLTDTYFKAIVKTGIIDSIVAKAEVLAGAGLSKTDGKKTESLRGYAKLEDAKFAGSKRSEECSIIFTEGDSAKALAMAGLNVIGGDTFGVFPLKGKLKNVVNESGTIDVEKLNKNEEIEAIKKIIGLKVGAKYDSLKQLRYGKIVIMADQDEDGFHIRGLLINLINKFWPSLVKYEGFINCFPTPIVKVMKGIKTKNPQEECFYDLHNYGKWKEENNDGKGWTEKYYKGLATSTREEAMEYFKHYIETLITYYCKKASKSKKEDEAITDGTELSYMPRHKDPTTEAISLAFDKDRSKIDRKVWMNNFDATDYIDTTIKRVPYTEFFDKELRSFSIYNARRAIPNLMDGFKPVHAKIYFTADKKNIYDKEVRVSTLAGNVVETAMYHHGEASLQGAIIKMAQNYVGANNLNLLHPQGQFGTRLESGNDAGSARYIHTFLSPICKKIFNPDDYNVLEQQYEEGQEIEPKWQAPVVPLLLINGTSGIGTGWSSDVYPCNPREVVNNVRRVIDEKKPKKMHPWYRHFNGEIRELEDNKYTIHAKYEMDGDKLHITDLPVTGLSIMDYKAHLEKLIDQGLESKKAEKNTSRKEATKKSGSKTAKGKPQPKGKGKAPARGKKGAQSRAKAKKTRVIKIAKSSTISKYIKSYSSDLTDVKINITIIFHPGKLDEFIKSHTLEKLEKELKLVAPISLNNMNAFDETGKIITYKSYSAILKAYVKVKLDVLQKRKDYNLDKYQKELDLLEWKLKFVEGVIDGEIIVFKNNKSKSKEQIHARLEELGFPKFAKPSKEQKEKPSYYYTDISIYKLTKEEVDKLRKEVEDKKEEIAILEGKTPEQIWTEELDEFMIEYEKWEEEANREYEKALAGGNQNKNKKKKVTKRNTV